MKTLEIQGFNTTSRLFVGERLENAGSYLPGGGCIIITDETVHGLYGDRFPKAPVIRIGTGEAVKTLDTVRKIYEQLVEMEADRSAYILAVGGGIVTDVAGFAASTYLRGVGFGFVSTTILAQVDASVGGKNGVNFGGYKNMVGVFNQPDFVICDLSLLSTLPKQEILSGFAEIVKHCAIANGEMFALLEEKWKKALALEEEIIETLIFDSVHIKSEIVNADEREQGARRKLNFGHTFGHAVEKVLKIPHGEAVSVGMAASAMLSARKGYLPESEATRIPALLERMGLPIRIEADPGRLVDALKRDKKRKDEYIHFVLLRSIGEAVVEPLPIKELEEVIHEICGQ